MPLQKSFFEYFPELEDVSLEGILRWLNLKESPKFVENELGNRILYPQALPVTEKDMLLDWAILRELLKSQACQYYNKIANKIYIPHEFLERFPDVSKLIWAFTDALQPQGIVSLGLKGENVGVKNLGTLICPKILKKDGLVNVWVDKEKYEVQIGSLMVIPTNDNHTDIKFESASARLLGRGSLSAEVVGGPFGVAIDAREKVSA